MPQSRKTKKHINKKYRKSNRKRKTYNRTYKRKRTRRSANKTRRHKRKSMRGGMEGGAAGGIPNEKASILEQERVDPTVGSVDRSKRLPLTGPLVASTECAKLFEEFRTRSVLSYYNNISQREIMIQEEKKLRNTLVDESKEIYIDFLLRSMPVVNAVPAALSAAQAQTQVAQSATAAAPTATELSPVPQSDIEMELRAMSPRELHERAMAEGMTSDTYEAREAAELVGGKVQILESSSHETLYKFTDEPRPIRFPGSIANFREHMKRERQKCNRLITSLARINDEVDSIIPKTLEHITFDDGHPLDLLSLVEGKSQLRFMDRNGDTMELKFTELHPARGFRRFMTNANDRFVDSFGEIDWREFSLDDGTSATKKRSNSYGVTLDPSGAEMFAIDIPARADAQQREQLNPGRIEEILKLKRMSRRKLEKVAVENGIIPKERAKEALARYKGTQLIDLILEKQNSPLYRPRAVFDMEYHADLKSPVDISECQYKGPIYCPMPSLYFHLKLQDIADPSKEYLFRILYDFVNMGHRTICPVLRVEMSLYTLPEVQFIGDCVKLRVFQIPGSPTEYPILRDHKSFKQPTLSDYLRSGLEPYFFNIVDFSTVPSGHKNPVSGGAAGPPRSMSDD